MMMDEGYPTLGGYRDKPWTDGGRTACARSLPNRTARKVPCPSHPGLVQKTNWHQNGKPRKDCQHKPLQPGNQISLPQVSFFVPRPKILAWLPEKRRPLSLAALHPRGFFGTAKDLLPLLPGNFTHLTHFFPHRAERKQSSRRLGHAELPRFFFRLASSLLVAQPPANFGQEPIPVYAWLQDDCFLR